MSCKTKVGNLQNSFVVDEKVGRLHISMQDAVLVEVFQSAKQLQHVALDHRLGEPDGRIVEETRKIMVHVGRDHVDDGFLAFVLWKWEGEG